MVKINGKLIFYLFSVLSVAGFSCTNNSNSMTENEQDKVLTYYANGSVASSVSYKDGIKNGLQINYYPDGSIKSFGYNFNGYLDGEYFWFREDHSLDTKAIYSNGIMQGVSYHFYSSGYLLGFRYWEAGKKQGYCFDYYDTIGVEKSLLYYNEDNLIYRKNLDTFNNVTSIEGNPPIFQDSTDLNHIIK